VSFAAAGAVEAFDAAALTQRVASVAAVDASAVRVVAAAASITVHVQIVSSSASAESVVRGRLTSATADQAAASAALGVTVLTDPVVAGVVHTTVAPILSPSPPPAAPTGASSGSSSDGGATVGIVIGCIAGALVLGVGAFVAYRRIHARENAVKPTSTTSKYDDSAKALASGPVSA